MDDSSRHTTAFLESLQHAVRQLGDVRNHYQRLATGPDRPYLVLSSYPFRVHEKSTVREFNGSVAIGLHVRGADSKEYELGIDILWDSERWTLITEAWVEADEGGQNLLRKLPERTASDSEGCRRELTSAVADLFKFDDLVPRKS